MCGMVAYTGSRGRAGVALALALGCAQAAARVLRPRDGMIPAAPVRVEEHFSAAELRRARDFRRPQLVLGLGSGAVELVLLAALAARPPEVLERARPAVAGAALPVASTLAPLPVRAVARRRAVQVGLVTQPWSGWAGDLAQGGTVGAGLAAGGAAAADALIGRLPRAWWLPASALVTGFGAVTAFAGPVVLDPIFNRFRRLPDGELRRDVLDLAERAGVRVGEGYVVDASRRTTAANAYVTGLGATKRIVLFDTLVEHFTLDETRLVVAHELAHVRHRDVPRALAFTALTAPLGTLAVATLAPRRSGVAALPGLVLAMGAVSAPVGMIANALSREVERRADAFSLRLTGATEPFVSFERRITVRNVGDPDPPRLLTALFATHPSTVERIGIARAYQEGRR